MLNAWVVEWGLIKSSQKDWNFHILFKVQYLEVLKNISVLLREWNKQDQKEKKN